MNSTVEVEGKKQWRKDVEETLGILVRQLPEELHTQATRRFCEKYNAPVAPTAPTAPCAAQTSDTAQHEAELCELKAVNARLLQDVQRSAQAHDEAQAQNLTLQAALREKEAQLEDTITALAHAEQKLTKLKTQHMQDPEPAKLEHMLAKLSPPLRDIAGKYFAIEHIHIFLIQCGQFSRITQCWEACVRWVLAEKPIPTDMADFLLHITQLYNKGSAQAEAKAFMAEVGNIYDFERYHRVGQDGPTVRHALLPGLENAAGKIVHKALVILS